MYGETSGRKAGSLIIQDWGRSVSTVTCSLQGSVPRTPPADYARRRLWARSSDRGSIPRDSTIQKPPEMAAFPLFPTVPATSQFTAIHSKSLQLPQGRGQNVGTDGHGFTRSLVVRGIGAPTVPPPGSPRRRRLAAGSRRSCRATRVRASLSRRALGGTAKRC